MSAALSTLALPTVRTIAPRSADVRRAVDAYRRTRARAEGCTVEDDDDLDVYSAAADRYSEAKEAAIVAVMQVLGDVDYPAALDLGDCIVVIDHDPEDEFNTDDPQGQAVICVIPTDRIVRA